MTPATLVAVPNVSEGRDAGVLDAIAAGFGPLLHRSADPDHNRAVFTLAGAPGALHARVLAGAREAIARIDLTRHDGVHPRVGALDVAPIVYLRAEDRGAACAEALVLADELGELGVPVYLYGELAGGRTRAELRRGGPHGLAERGTPPDFGPRELHPTAGATLVAARPPLVAFNVEVAATLEQARAIAADLRRTLPGVRALGLELHSTGTIQVSTNLEGEATPAQVVEAVHPVRAVADEQHRPLLADDGEGPLDGALLGVEIQPPRHPRSLADYSIDSQPSCVLASRYEVRPFPSGRYGCGSGVQCRRCRRPTCAAPQTGGRTCGTPSPPSTGRSSSAGRSTGATRTRRRRPTSRCVSSTPSRGTGSAATCSPR
jgi:glutamate formiminotransferase